MGDVMIASLVHLDLFRGKSISLYKMLFCSAGTFSLAEETVNIKMIQDQLEVAEGLIHYMIYFHKRAIVSNISRYVL